MIALFKKSGKLLRHKLLGFFALTTMAFIFQACYGPPRGKWAEEVLISGSVTNADGSKAVGSCFPAKINNHLLTISTNQAGEFGFYVSQIDVADMQLVNPVGENDEVDSKCITIAKVDTVRNEPLNIILQLHAQ